jgi:hypothetical protein
MVGLFFTQGRLFSKQWRPNPVVAGIFGYGFLCLFVEPDALLLDRLHLRQHHPHVHRHPPRHDAAANAWPRWRASACSRSSSRGGRPRRLGANHQGAADERFLLNYINIEMIKAHPLVGIGLNQCYLYALALHPVVLQRTATGSTWRTINILLIGAETG